MKNITDCYKKGNHPLDNSKLKSILSFLTISVFIFLGFASIEESPPLDCEFYDIPFHKSHAIVIEIFDKGTGKPIQNQTIKFNLTEFQKEEIIPSVCFLEVKNQYSKTLTSDPNGKIALSLNKDYLSLDDETQITFNFTNNSYYEVSHSIIINPTHGDLTNRYEFLKKEVYP